MDEEKLFQVVERTLQGMSQDERERAISNALVEIRRDNFKLIHGGMCGKAHPFTGGCRKCVGGSGCTDGFKTVRKLILVYATAAALSYFAPYQPIVSEIWAKRFQQTITNPQPIPSP